MLQTKVLTSQSAKESRVADPKAQVSADEVKCKKPQEEAEGSVAPKKKVASQMVLNKFQRDQERRQYREETAQNNEGYWRCPFFVYCWEEWLALPTVDNYPECNSFYCWHSLTLLLGGVNSQQRRQKCRWAFHSSVTMNGLGS